MRPGGGWVSRNGLPISQSHVVRIHECEGVLPSLNAPFFCIWDKLKLFCRNESAGFAVKFMGEAHHFIGEEPGE